VGLSPQRIFAIASIALLTWINVRGVRTAAFIQTTLTAIKTAALAVLILLGFTIGRNAAAIAANFGANFWAGGVCRSPSFLWSARPWWGRCSPWTPGTTWDSRLAKLKIPRKDLPFRDGGGRVDRDGLYVLANVAYLLVLPADAIAHAPQDRVGRRRCRQSSARRASTSWAIANMDFDVRVQ